MLANKGRHLPWKAVISAPCDLIVELVHPFGNNLLCCTQLFKCWLRGNLCGSLFSHFSKTLLYRLLFQGKKSMWWIIQSGIYKKTPLLCSYIFRQLCKYCRSKHEADAFWIWILEIVFLSVSYCCFERAWNLKGCDMVWWYWMLMFPDPVMLVQQWYFLC